MLDELTPPGASRVWTALWLSWIAAFFALEVPPLVRKRPEDTLSDHVWLWFDIPRNPAPSRDMRARRLVLLTFVVWLAAHFLSGDRV